ncbi:uncharacterized protein LOC119670946 [Teleopsis dalmanni]|uniref:uncharacterized protein LOC119670946 n=1 Tax=Teleopsis dalmanni TaxID=139649 RepID=UPI0018CD2D3C|nr:uncharacterized protein LOC119670946 [Teleopsis dalmanni]
MAMLPLHDTMKKILEKDNYLSEMLAEIKKLKDSHNFTNYFFNTSRAMTLKISYKLEQQILLMFPTEKLEYYRCDRRGKIYSRFCYLRQSLKNIEKKQSAPESHDGSKVIYEDVAADAVKRLRYENVDASELNELWQLSSSSRLEKIVNDCLSLSDIFKLWPEYKKPTGYRLIDLDFKHLYSSANDILDIFEPKMKKLYDFFSKPNTLKDSNCSVLLKKLTDDVVAKG